MKNLIFLILFLCSTWNILQAQQRVAPFSLGGKYIHKLDSCFTLTDSINFEVENVEHNQSQQIQAYQIKDYVNAQSAQKVFNLSVDLTDTSNVIVTANAQYYDLDGDSLFYTCVKVNSSFSLRFWKDSAHTDGASLDTGGGLIYQNVNTTLYPSTANAGYWGLSAYFTTSFHAYPEIFFQFYNSINQIGGTALGMAQPTGGAQFQLILSL